MFYFFTASSFDWNFGPGASPNFSSNLVPPPVSWSSPGWKTVSFTAYWPPTCSITFVDSVEISALAATVDAGPNQTIERNEYADLGASTGFSFYWYSDIPSRYSGQFQQNIRVWPQDDTTTYYVLVIGNYKTRDFALAAVDQLPANLKKNKPWPVPLKNIQKFLN